MAEISSLPQVQAVRTRFTVLDFGSGVPLPGAANMYVTSALIKFAFKHVTETGAEIKEPNAAGEICVDYQAPDTLLRGDVTVDVCTPDPYLSVILGGGDLLTDGGRHGLAAPPIGPIGDRAVSIECWAKRINNGVLDVDSPYAWWVFPRISNLLPGDISLENAAYKPGYVGRAFENPNWFNGPLNDWPAESDRMYQWLPTDTVPAATGLTALSAS